MLVSRQYCQSQEGANQLGQYYRGYGAVPLQEQETFIARIRKMIET